MNIGVAAVHVAPGFWIVNWSAQLPAISIAFLERQLKSRIFAIGLRDISDLKNPVLRSIIAHKVHGHFLSRIIADSGNSRGEWYPVLIARRSLGVIPGFACFQIIKSIIKNILFNLIHVVQANLKILKKLVIKPNYYLFIIRCLSISGDTCNPAFSQHLCWIRPGPQHFIIVAQAGGVWLAIAVFIPPVEIVFFVIKRMTFVNNWTPDWFAIQAVVELQSRLAVAKKIIGNTDSGWNIKPVNQIINSLHIKFTIGVKADCWLNQWSTEFTRKTAGGPFVNVRDPAFSTIKT